MNARRLAAVLAVAALGGCEDGGTGTELDLEASLAVTITIAPGLSPDPDAGTLHLEGPTPRTVPIAPGQTLTIENLQPGGYTVSLEAFSAGRLELFAETTTTVIAGQNRSVSLTLRSFIPSNVAVPGEVDAGAPVTVTWGGVPGATSYVVQWADNPQFSNAQQQEVPGTSTTFAFEVEGDYQVRVFARNRFGSNGVPAPPPPVLATPPPIVLQEGVPVPDRAGAAGTFTYYSLEVPDGPPNRVLQVRIRGGVGDADLLVRLGSRPAVDAFDCASIITPGEYSNSLDFCAVMSPDPGKWYVAIFGAEAYEGVTLDASLLPYDGLPSGAPIAGLSGGLSEIRYFEVGVPTGAPPSGVSRPTVVSASAPLGTPKPGAVLDKGRMRAPPPSRAGPQAVAGTLHLFTTGGTGDVDLLASPRTSPFGLSDAAGWPCVGLSDANEEACDVGDPDAGPWTVVLVGYAPYAGVTLGAEFIPPAPVISNPRYTVVSVNDAGLCANGGTKIDVTVDYTDPNGDVGDPVPFTAEFTFSPSGSIGTNTQDVARDGTGDAGAVTAGYCVIFGGDTQLSLDITIADTAGLESNRVGLAIPKPTGANAPGATPGVAPAGSR